MTAEQAHSCFQEKGANTNVSDDEGIRERLKG